MPIKGVIGVNGVSAAVEFARRGVGIMAAPWVAVKAKMSNAATWCQCCPILPHHLMAFTYCIQGAQYLPLKVRRFVDLAADRLRATVEELGLLNGALLMVRFGNQSSKLTIKSLLSN